MGNDYLLFIGIAYLFIAGIDMMHLLAYKGMGVFPDRGPNPPTQLWIAARYLESIALAAGPIFLVRKLKSPRFLMLLLGAIVAVTLSSIFIEAQWLPGWLRFPDCYIDGVGLTGFKIISEYVICGFLLAALAMLLRLRKEMDRHVLGLLVGSIILTIMSELAFTFYVSVYDLSNIVGHLLKIASFYLIYKALISTGLNKPLSLLLGNIKGRDVALLESRENLRAMFEQAADAMFLTGFDGRFVDVNQRTCDVLGYTRDELLKMSIPQINPIFPEERFIEFRNNMELGKPLTVEAVHQRKDGSTFPVEIRTRLIEIGGERRFLSLVRDITERKLSEKQLRDSLQMSDDLLRAIPSGVSIYKYEAPDKLFMIDTNEAGEEILGIKLSDCKGKEFNELWPEARKMGFTDIHLNVARTGETFSTEGLTYKDNRVDSAFRVRSFVLPNSRLAIAFEDVTEQKRAEDQLQNLAKFPSENPNPILRFAADGKIIYANQASADVLETWGRSVGEHIPQPYLQCVIEAFESGEVSKFELICNNGRIFSVTLAPLPAAGYANAYGLDITQSEQAEQALRQTRNELELRVKDRTKELSQTIDTLQEEVLERTRLEQEVLRIGELERHRIGRDLHDSLGQMLSGISCLTQVLHRKLESKSIDEATDAARIESIAVDSIKLTRSIAKGLNPIEQSPDGLMIAMREMASNTENMFAVNCHLDCSEPVLLDDHVVATHIHRIAQEAVTNAVRHGQAKNIRVALAASDGHILLTVSDDGLGMPENITTSSGIGLRTMRYRAESIQASLNIGQSPTGETIISCKVPMEITDDS